MGEVSTRRVQLSQYLTYWNNIKEFINLMTHSYQVMPAISSDLEKEAYKVRHKVYCTELNYEESNPEGLESDDFDHHSTQMVVYSRADKAYIGCLRLVHGHKNGQYHTLPFEHHCKDELDHKIINMIKQSGHKYAEVSRLAIDREFRHIGKKNGNKTLGKKSKSSFVLLSLYLGLQALARQQNVRYLFAIVEPRLLNNLHRHSIPAIKIGNGINHRGIRIPILIDVEDIERIIPSIMRPLYGTIHKDISRLLAPISIKSDEDLSELTNIDLEAYLAKTRLPDTEKNRASS
jgi:N-acyl amino acid synthase of PEP-CTERM/exosortase system